jgi:hypothetical protein
MEQAGAHINYICKYVDDILAIVNVAELETVLNAFHSFHKSLCFTYEMEKDGKIPYLEVLLIRDSVGSIELDWYQKPTATNRILNYMSNHPSHQILNTAENLIRRATTLCSERFKPRNLKRAQNILKENNYPDNIIKKLTYRACNNKTNNSNVQPPATTPTTTPDTEPKIYKSLTYIKGVSEKITNSVRQVSNNVQIALKTNKNYQQIKSVTKDQAPMLDHTNLIYNIPCSECDLSYVGQTSQYLKKRIDQHKKSTQRTAVFIHKEEENHTLDFDSVEILQREPQKRKREFLEMLHINNLDTINIKTDIIGINNTYKPILRKLRHLKFV